MALPLETFTHNSDSYLGLAGGPCLWCLPAAPRASFHSITRALVEHCCQGCSGRRVAWAVLLVGPCGQGPTSRTAKVCKCLPRFALGEAVFLLGPLILLATGCSVFKGDSHQARPRGEGRPQHTCALGGHQAIPTWVCLLLSGQYGCSPHGFLYFPKRTLALLSPLPSV